MPQPLSASAMSLSEKRLRFFGKWIAMPTFAIGSSVTVTLATASIGFISGLALPWMILVLSLIFLAETSVNVYLFKNVVPDTLVACFIQNIFYKLSNVKKTLLGLGIFASLGAGLAFAALTFLSSNSAMGTILGLFFSLSCPPLGIVFASILGVSAVFCLTCLFIKHIEVAIRNDIHLKVLQFFKEMFTRVISKPLMQQVLEAFFKLTFIAAILILAFVGTYAFLGTMQGGVANFLSLIPGANALAVQISSYIIAYGLMGVARVPFILNTACSSMSYLGGLIGKTLYQLGCCIGSSLGLYKPGQSEPQLSLDKKVDENCSSKTILVTLMKGFAVVIHGFCFGGLARGGAPLVTDLMKGAGFSPDAVNLTQAGETAALIAQGSVQAAISAHAFFAKSPKKNEDSDPPRPEQSVSSKASSHSSD